jgi:hypothetical protein
MKQVMLTVMAALTVLVCNAQNEMNLPTAGSNSGNPIEILVDGKHYAIITDDHKNPPVSVAFTSGQHEISWVRKNPVDDVLPDLNTETVETKKVLPLPGRVDRLDKIIDLNPGEMDSIKVEIYDNGVVDNDSVSVFADNVAVITDQKVSTKPITFYTSIGDGEDSKIIKMQAKNLGLIPPNTSLMVVTTKNKKYVLHLETDLLKNAVVKLVVKKD